MDPCMHAATCNQDPQYGENALGKRASFRLAIVACMHAYTY